MDECDYDFYALIDTENRTRAIVAVNKNCSSWKESAEEYLDYLYNNKYGHPVNPSDVICCTPSISLPRAIKEYLCDVAKEDAYPRWLGAQKYYGNSFNHLNSDELNDWLPLEIVEGE